MPNWDPPPEAEPQGVSSDEIIWAPNVTMNDVFISLLRLIETRYLTVYSGAPGTGEGGEIALSPDLDGGETNFWWIDISSEVFRISSGTYPTFADRTVVFQIETDGSISTGGLWTTWTPSYTNLTIGDGTVSARYFRLGKWICAEWSFTLGSTSAVGSGPTVSLPVTAISYPTGAHIGSGNAYDNTGPAAYPMATYFNSTTTVLLRVHDVTGTYAVDTNVTATVPFTWATNDVLYFKVIYEAA